MSEHNAAPVSPSALGNRSERVRTLVARMTLEEKIGQLAQVPGGGGIVPDALRDAIRAGRVGSVINEVDAATNRELQRIATEESRLGIPLLIGRDVIHGFHTVLPIPLGQAASWNPALIERGGRVAAREAARVGINWTFAPMIDIARDPRWGRVAESLGEDPFLTSTLGAAMVRGFQGGDDGEGRIAACAKHFAGYGASESGRDYATTDIPERELRNTYLLPFHAAVRAGVGSVMTSFGDLDGVPASANAFLLRQVLREEWGFDGLVVSDWMSIAELTVHGLTESDRESAREAANAGVDMEMTSTTFATHLSALVRDGEVSASRLDEMVGNVLALKERLGLFERPSPALGASHDDADVRSGHLRVAYEAALESVVLLENDGTLPLDRSALRSIAVIGPLADDGYEQMGTWTLDGDASRSTTVLDAIRARAGDGVEVLHVRALESTRDRSTSGIAEAVAVAARSDVAIVVVGEEAILSGEAHSRADISLPGAGEALVEAIAATGTPVVLVLMAGRPLAVERVAGRAGAILFAWHPGSMGGAAIADLLFGVASPSGKLPVTFPRVTGQVPIYYAQKRSGRPVTDATYMHIDDIPVRARQDSLGNTSYHLDTLPTPMWAFGHGRSYTTFAYDNVRSDPETFTRDGGVTISADVINTGVHQGTEIVQLYVRDVAGSIVRPPRELKGFARVRLEPGERRTVSFTLGADDLAFHGRDLRRRAEPGRFLAGIGGSSTIDLSVAFSLVAD